MSGSAAEATLLVRHELGLHARPAAQFVKTACAFDCDITVWRDDQQANAKSILGILSLSVNQGTRIRVCASGPDAEQALRALSEIVERNFEDVA